MHPRDGETTVHSGASLVIQFNEAVDPTSLAFTVTPDPGGWTAEWNPTFTQVTLRHTVSFSMGTYYEVSLTASDPLGNTMVAAYEWSFWIAHMQLYFPLLFR